MRRMRRTNILSTSDEPTVLLVHGALTDASVWNDVTPRLQAAGLRVAAPALPMRSLEGDAEYLVGVIERLGGPIVLVAHSWAGAVISHPAVVASGAVVALVYVAAFQPERGETAGELNERFPGSLLTPENLSVVSTPLGGTELTLRPDRFAAVYAADVNPAHAAVMAVAQRPIDPAALGEPLPGDPSWKTVPSWAVVSTRDRSLPTAALRFMADRAGSRVVEVESSHAVPVSRPDVVADVILEAAGATAAAGIG
jgi:pimeloyl-ACP methyl ester carboxylesterase